MADGWMPLSAPLVLPNVGTDMGEVNSGRLWRKLLAAVPIAFLALCLLGTFLVQSGSRPASLAEGAPGANLRLAVTMTDSEIAVSNAYTSVQYLGFNLFTAPGTTADGCFEDGLGGSSGSCYLGSSIVEEDLLKRLGIMQNAIENAFKSSCWDRNQSTLKIFMAPEFYWRGARGAYRVQSNFSSISRPVVAEMHTHLSHPRFHNWLFILGTIVAAQGVDSNFVKEMDKPFANISYYNLAAVHIGGTDRVLLETKHYISSIDFLKADPRRARESPLNPPPGKSDVFCKQHPTSNGCIYAMPSKDLLAELGFGPVEVVQGSVFQVGGIDIGIEICLDHAEGRLAKTLGANKSVDIHLIVSAGMEIAAGPVCTRQGGPTFLSDGFARTELNFNVFGHGREHVHLPSGQIQYDVGMVYGADSLVALEQWIGTTIDAFTGTGFGTRVPGIRTLPGGDSVDGDTGIPFVQVSALGTDWFAKLQGYYDTASYTRAGRVASLLKKRAEKLQRAENVTLFDSIQQVTINPTVDIYGPFALAA